MSDGGLLDAAQKSPFPALDAQIEAHQQKDASRSVLSWAIGKAWRSDENSLAGLEKLRDEAFSAQRSGDKAAMSVLQKQLADRIRQDKEAVELQDEISHYVGGGLKTAALFFNGGKGAGLLRRGGWVGMAATVGLYGLDQATMKDDVATFGTNFALGGLKGGLTKSVFFGLSKANMENIALKGVSLGVSSRLIDTGLTPKNYMDANGNFNLSKGLNKTWGDSVNLPALTMDVLLMGSAHGLSKGANWASGGALLSRPFYQTVLTAGTFGMSNGAAGELLRQRNAGEEIDLKKIAMRGLLQGGVDAVAGIPGGLAIDKNFRARPLQTLAEDFMRTRNNLGVGLDVVQSKLSALSWRLTPELQPVLAMADGPSMMMMTTRPGQIAPPRLYMTIPEAESMRPQGAKTTGGGDGGSDKVEPTGKTAGGGGAERVEPTRTMAQWISEKPEPIQSGLTELHRLATEKNNTRAAEILERLMSMEPGQIPEVTRNCLRSADLTRMCLNDIAREVLPARPAPTETTPRKEIFDPEKEYWPHQNEVPRPKMDPPQRQALEAQFVDTLTEVSRNPGWEGIPVQDLAKNLAKLGFAPEQVLGACHESAAILLSDGTVLKVMKLDQSHLATGWMEEWGFRSNDAPLLAVKGRERVLFQEYPEIGEVAIYRQPRVQMVGTFPEGAWKRLTRNLSRDGLVLGDGDRVRDADQAGYLMDRHGRPLYDVGRKGPVQRIVVIDYAAAQKPGVLESGAETGKRIMGTDD